jgi:hypothetical protein
MRESLKLRLEPRSFQDGSGWYALAIWGHRPPEEIGRFATKEQVEDWIAEVLNIWTWFRDSDAKLVRSAKNTNS